MRAAFAVLLLALAVASPAAALRKPNGKGCNCKKTPTTNKPVCGADFVTYGNECVAFCENVLIAYQGACKSCKIRTNNCNCGNQPYRPVCSFGLTWINECDALCGGYSCQTTKGVCQYRASDGARFSKTPVGRTKPGSNAVKAAANPNRPFPAKNSAHYSYTQALHYVQIFVESMRSGRLKRQRLAWRSDSCLKCKGPSGEDLSGGFYEAGGSFLKLGLVESFLVTLLADSVLSFPTGFKKAGDLTNAIDNIQWGVDYLLKCHSRSNRFVAVLGNDTYDFNYYGSVERYDKYVPKRPSCYVDKNHRGSEITAEAAAALASSVIVFKTHKIKRNYTGILRHAEELYLLATKYPGSYQSANSKSCLGIHKRLYASQNGYIDEIAWAAAWLYRATKKGKYLSDARKYYGQLQKQQPAYSFETGNKIAGLNVLMQQIDPSNAGRYLANAKGYFRIYLEQIIPHTPRGLAYPYHFGALRPTTQMAFLALKQSKLLVKKDKRYAAQLFNYATFQINYVLGDSGRSWLVGFGKLYPKYIWHKLSYNSYISEPLRGIKVYAGLKSQKTDGRVVRLRTAEAAKFDMEGSRHPQRFIAYGALYGAPLPDDSIVAGRKDYSYAEPTTDGVSGIAGALAGLAEYFTSKQGTQSDCGLDLGWTHPGAKATAKSVNNTRICARKGM